MQKITLIGRLTRDARIVETQNGNKFVAFTIAVNARTGTTEKATYYDVRQFNYNERMAPHFTQGSSLVVIGELDASIEERDGNKYLRLSVLADSIDFNGGGSSQNSNQNGGAAVTPVTALKTTTQQSTTVQKTEPVEEDVVVTGRKTKTMEPVEDGNDLPF